MKIMKNKKYFSKKANIFYLKFYLLTFRYFYRYFKIRPVFASILFFGTFSIAFLLQFLRFGESFLNFKDIILFVFCIFGINVFFFSMLLSEYPEQIPNGKHLMKLYKQAMKLSRLSDNSHSFHKSR